MGYEFQIIIWTFSLISFHITASYATFSTWNQLEVARLHTTTNNMFAFVDENVDSATAYQEICSASVVSLNEHDEVEASEEQEPGIFVPRPTSKSVFIDASQLELSLGEKVKQVEVSGEIFITDSPLILAAAASSSPHNLIKICKKRSFVKKSKRDGRWTKTEHQMFELCMKFYGHEWSKIARHIPTRTSTQVRSHAQKYLATLERRKQKQQAEYMLDEVVCEPTTKTPEPTDCETLVASALLELKMTINSMPSTENSSPLNPLFHFISPATTAFTTTQTSTVSGTDTLMSPSSERNAPRLSTTSDTVTTRDLVTNKGKGENKTTSEKLRKLETLDRAQLNSLTDAAQAEATRVIAAPQTVSNEIQLTLLRLHEKYFELQAKYVSLKMNKNS